MRRVGHMVAGVLCGVLLAGCGGAPEASDPPSPSQPETATDVPPPPAPSEARSQDARGAESFVRHYVDVLNFAGRTGDVTALEALGERDCVRCKALVDGIAEIYREGGTINGGGWDVTSVQTYGMREGRFFLDATIDSTPQSVTAADGTTETYDGAEGRLRAFVLKPSSNGWTVAEMDPTV